MKEERVLEWFLGRKGEMFEKREAVEKISGELDLEEDEAWSLINHLVSDLVDPVVQIFTEGEKYVGVIEFEEHGFWYEYVHYSDVGGEKRRGVCVQCVKESEKDKEVFHATEGMGSISREASSDEIGSRIEEHVENRHEVKPSEFEVGATLASGTTIGGNLAIHLGNDAPDNSVQATNLDGQGSASFIDKGAAFQQVESTLATGSITSQISNTSITDPYGATVENDCIWYVEQSTNNIVEVDRSGSITDSMAAQGTPAGLGFIENKQFYQADQSGNSIHRIGTGEGFRVPGTFPEGVGIDSSGCIWFASNGNDSIYRFDQLGNLEKKIDAPDTAPLGLGVDTNTGCLWNADFGDESIYRINPSDGSIDQSFGSPGTNARGLGVDRSGSSTDGCLWHADEDDESIYRLDQSGNVDQSFASPDFAPEGVGIDDSTGCIWHVDGVDETINRIDPSTGNVDQSFASPDSSADGLGVDSSGCLWHAGSGKGSIYRIDQSGNIEASQIVVSTFATPSNSPEGVTVHPGTKDVWFLDSNDQVIYRADQSITVNESFSAPSLASATGLGMGEDHCLWYSVDGGSGHSIFKVDQSGSLIESFQSPSATPKGVGFDHRGLIWHADSNSDSIYNIGAGNRMFSYKEL